MVILGGLEIVAAGYLLNEFNKDKIDARERRKHSNRPHRRESDENHGPKPSNNHDYRPNDRPPRPPAQHSNSSFLALPNVGPPRPSSAPPMPPMGPPQQSMTWPMPPQNPQPNQYQGPPSFQGPGRPPSNSMSGPTPGPGFNGPYQSQTFPMNNNNNNGPPRPQPQQSYPPLNQQFQGQPPPPQMQRPQTFHPNMPPNNGLHPQNAPPGYHLNHPSTISFSPQYQNRPPSNTFATPPPAYTVTAPPSQSFPVANPTAPAPFNNARPPIVQAKPNNIHANIPPGTYVDMKTGRIQHNLYPPDHPMARGIGSGAGVGGSMDDTDLAMLNRHRSVDGPEDTYYDRPRGEWRGHEMESVRDERGEWTRERRRDSSEDLAYGKSYERRDRSYERRRN